MEVGSNMRLYGRRFVKNYMDKRVRLQTETRDAIVWDIDWANYEARVKVQGSNRYLIAHFPRNWKERPYWLQPGNAVAIRHRSGVKGYIEITGEGRAIPTAVNDEGSLPEPETLPDMILSGLIVTETSPPSLGVWVTAGSYRINRVVYYIFPDVGDYITMDDPAPMIMDYASDEIMGGGIATVELDPAPAEGYYRYDLLVVGTDSQIDYIAGTPHRTDPQKPAVPSDHLQIGDYIFVRWDTTVIYSHDIGAEFTQLMPSSLTFDITEGNGCVFSGEFELFAFVPSGEAYYPNPEALLDVTIKDQYGLSLSMTNIPLTLEIVGGTGDVYCTDDGWATEVTEVFNGNHYQFKYRRDELQGDDERSPVFKATLTVLEREVTAGDYIILANLGGEPIPFGT